MAKKIERKYLAHYLDAAFSADGSDANYVRLGQDLEEFNLELNPDVETSKNILGENSIKHSGYDPQSDVDPYYASEGEPLWEKLAEIANSRLNGDDCMTTVVDVLLDSAGKVKWAYREKVMVIPNSIGGDTSGVQIPFSIRYTGERVKGTWAMETKTFTPSPTEAA